MYVLENPKIFIISFFAQSKIQKYLLLGAPQYDPYFIVSKIPLRLFLFAKFTCHILKASLHGVLIGILTPNFSIFTQKNVF